AWRRSAALDPLRWHRVLVDADSVYDVLIAHTSIHHGCAGSHPRTSADPAQADAVAQEGNEHVRLPAPVDRDRRADRVRSDARDADARRADRNPARADDRPADRRQEAGVRS